MRVCISLRNHQARVNGRRVTLFRSDNLSCFLFRYFLEMADETFRRLDDNYSAIDDTYNIVQEGYSQLSNNSVYSNVSTPFSSESSQVLATKSVIFSADDSALTGLRSLVLIVSFVF